MDRLTIEYLGGYVPKGLCSIDRLGSAYDCELCYENCKTMEERTVDCSGCAINQCFNRLGEYENTGLAPEQIIEMDKLYAEKCKELAELKKQMPPCKVGDTVYKPNSIILVEIQVESIFISTDGINISGRTTERKYPFCCKPADFGKTVFLTKEQAEEALKRMEDRDAGSI